MRFKHHIKRLELQASECQRSLEEVAEAHRALRARAVAATHIVDQVEALLDCARALAAAPSAGPDAAAAAAAATGTGRLPGGSMGSCGTGTLINLLALVGKGTIRELRSELAATEARLMPGGVDSSTMGAGAAAGHAGGAAGGHAAATVHWWPAGAAFLDEALQITTAAELKAMSRDTQHAIGILLP
jgi:hypothetical protein